MSYEHGNLNTVNAENPKKGHWVVGDFITGSDLRCSSVCQVKYVHSKRGHKKPTGSKMPEGERTLLILISGKWKVFLENSSITLENEGDYIIFDNVYHESECLEDCHLVVVRWVESKR